MFYLILRNKHKIKQNEEIEEYIPKKMNKIQPEEKKKKLNEMEISNLPDTISK